MTLFGIVMLVIDLQFLNALPSNTVTPFGIITFETSVSAKAAHISLTTIPSIFEGIFTAVALPLYFVIFISLLEV